ncbi:MAG: hypothetical protein M3290_09575 [Actinomycetota bacterium]|nr:hypothetical protein [Actinomycetota bacterium]
MSADIAATITSWITDRRWFASVGGSDFAVEILDSVTVAEGPPELRISIASIDFHESGRRIYHLPLLVEDGTARDAVDESRHLTALARLMVEGASIKGRHGTFHFSAPGLDPSADPPGTTSSRMMGAEQSNSSLVLDENVILKIFRRVEPGPNPDLELARALTGAGFDHIPAQLGEITYEGDDDHGSYDLALAQRFVADAEDGWTVAVRQVIAVYDETHEADVAEDVAFLTEERAAALLENIGRLGDVTAGLHVALSREELEPDLAPEPLTDVDLTHLADRIAATLDRLSAAGFAEIEGLDAHIQERVDAMKNLTEIGLKTRIHGDYHLGQALLARGEWMIVDFEGEPLKPFGERRAKHSPIRDVAGMLRSLNYAATAGLFERAEPDSEEWKHLQTWADAWEGAARDRFLTSYLTRAHEGRFLPRERETFAVLLDAFELDKALYEVEYELNHRPQWLRIPLRGVAQIIERSRR